MGANAFPGQTTCPDESSHGQVYHPSHPSCPRPLPRTSREMSSHRRGLQEDSQLPPSHEGGSVEEDMRIGTGSSGNGSVNGSMFPAGASGGLPLGPFRFPATVTSGATQPAYKDISAAASPTTSPMDTLTPVEVLPPLPTPVRPPPLPPPPTVIYISVGTDVWSIRFILQTKCHQDWGLPHHRGDRPWMR